MPKRSRYIRITEESKALKKLRMNLGLSQRELGRLLEVPQTRVAHIENGRAYIRRPYIELFLSRLDISWEAWDKLIGKSDSDEELRVECKKLIEKVSDEKLKVLHELLMVIN